MYIKVKVCVWGVLTYSKILELEEELKVVGNNMKSLEISEQEVKHKFAMIPLCEILHAGQNLSFLILCLLLPKIWNYFVVRQ